MNAAFVQWETYVITAADTIVRHIPLTLLWGTDPPLVLQRNGVPCSRIHMNETRHVVAYAGFGVENLRNIVEVIQLVEGV